MRGDYKNSGRKLLQTNGGRQVIHKHIISEDGAGWDNVVRAYEEDR